MRSSQSMRNVLGYDCILIVDENDGKITIPNLTIIDRQSLTNTESNLLFEGTLSDLRSRFRVPKVRRRRKK